VKGTTELDAKDKDLMTETFENIDLGCFKKVKLAVAAPSYVLSIMDRGVTSELSEQAWDEAQQMLVQAKAAYDRLLKEAQRLHQHVGNNKADSLWQLLCLTCIFIVFVICGLIYFSLLTQTTN